MAQRAGGCLRRKRGTVRTAIVISDTHCGDKFGLCPPQGARLQGGGKYDPSRFQRWVWRQWRDFHDLWIPAVTAGEPYALVFNGDAIEGQHHQATHPISGNVADQLELAYQCLAPIVDRSSDFYFVAGTPAHVGVDNQNEETLARRLGGFPDEAGACARPLLWMHLENKLLNIAHHIGTTSSASYESTAVMAELVALYGEAGRWKNQAPDAVIRSHRHRYCEVRVGAAGGFAISAVIAAWQLKTPWAYKVAGARNSDPQIGGMALRVGDQDGLYSRVFVRSMDRPATVVAQVRRRVA